MLCNDHRTRPYRWRAVDAIIEATAHDNSLADSDQAPLAEGHTGYAEELGISVAEAFAWANSFPGPTTLFLYDQGRVYAEREPEPGHE